MPAEDKSNAKQEAVDELYKQGMQVRRSVMGDAFVDRAMESVPSSEISGPIQEYITAACWGQVWTRPGLSKRDRSMLNLGMLCCLNRGTEFAGHVRGALNNGVTVEEISEIILQVAVYAGAPASLEGARIAEKVIKEWKESNAKAK
jgi:4-carboxymuconolactone decarboxylase